MVDERTPRERNRRERAAGRLLAFVLKQIDEVDDAAAIRRVQALREQHPEWTADQLTEHVATRKWQQAAAVGAATAGAGLIPGTGTLAALTVGTAADVTATLKLQTELVMEIAAVHQRRLSTDEKRRIVALITGLTLGRNRLLSRGGARLSLQLTERYASRWVAHTLPFLGVAASAGIDVLSMYVVGRRAHAYFALGPEAMGSWLESVRALSGVDERALASLVVGARRRTWRSPGVTRAGTRVQSAAGAATGTLANAARAASRQLAAGSGRVTHLLPRPRSNVTDGEAHKQDQSSTRNTADRRDADAARQE